MSLNQIRKKADASELKNDQRVLYGPQGLDRETELEIAMRKK